MTNLPVPARVSTLNQEITALTERLSPASEDAIAVSLGSMQTAGMTIPAGIEPKNVMTVYRYALQGVPACGLKEATKKLLKGDYAGNPDILLGMVPKPPILAALAKAEARIVREDLARKRDAIQALTHTEPEIDRTPEVMARVRAKAAAFKAEVKATRDQSRESPLSEPMGADAAEYWQKIQALNDAPGELSAEQAAYRRKITAHLPVAGSSPPSADLDW